MDIQKEKERFEAWLIAEFKLKNHDYALYFVNGEYQRTPTQARWQAWQAAKANAVPEGFVVVPKEPTEAMHQAGQDTMIFGGGYDDIYVAMIEAQEPK